MNIIGVDPGVSGAVFVIKSDETFECFDMPTFEARRNKKNKRHVDAEALVREIKACLAPGPSIGWAEAVSAMPGQGVTSSFLFGRSLGAVEGAFAGLGIPLNKVTAAVWKKAMGVTSDKRTSLEKARGLFPSCEECGVFRLVAHADRAEAALIAQYGTQQL